MSTASTIIIAFKGATKVSHVVSAGEYRANDGVVVGCYDELGAAARTDHAV